MSEIIYVLLSGLWILGLSLILSVLAIASYLAGENRQPLGKVLSTGQASLFITLGAVLFCAGLAGLTGPLWQKVLWGLLGLGFIVLSFHS
jgi:hypothetical protein